MLKNLLVYRLALFNIVFGLFLAGAATQGWVQYVFVNDHSHISYLIALVFGVGLLGTLQRAKKVAEGLNALKEGNSASLKKDIAKMPIKNAYLHTILDTLTGLAIVGTIIGLVLMTKEIDVTNIQASLPAVLSGISVAFMATLTGIVSAMVLSVNVRMLDTATGLLLKDSEV